ncbi:hypothetical protein [Sansalvadorimonas verongulae]|uniref:hypothetical protein n=1 Tax=Sansalvadorimonas verongulae TaxID=2172824 RepID=UPI001E3B4DA9|nr:hypothetical protein [Sansalvadorimonas verongulae]
MEQRVFPAISEHHPDKGYFIGPLFMDNDQSTLALEVTPHQDGILVMLRVLPVDEHTLATMQAGIPVTGLYLKQDKNKVRYQPVDLYERLTGERKEIHIATEYQGAKLAATAVGRQSTIVPDPIAVLNYLIENHKRRAFDDTSVKDKAIADFGETAGDMVDALDTIFSQQPSSGEELLTFLAEGELETLQVDGHYVLPVRHFDSSLASPAIQQRDISPQPNRLNPTPRKIITTYSRDDMPDLGHLTSSFSIEGPGDIMFFREDGTSAQGDQYFFQVKEDTANNGLVVALHRLHRPTVEESAEFQPADRAPLYLYINEHGAILKGLDEKTHDSIIFNRPFSKLREAVTFINQLETINYVPLANMMSEWVATLQEQKNAKPPVLDEILLRYCFSGGFTSTQKLHTRISFDPPPEKVMLNMGFKDSRIHTSMLTYPSLPAKGIVPHSIYMKDEFGNLSEYSIHVRQYSSQSYIATLHQWDKKGLIKDHERNHSELLMNGKSDALATLFVEYTGPGVMFVHLVDRENQTQIATQVDTEWDPEIDRISLLPVTLPPDTTVRVNLPALSLCTNILAHASSGTFKGMIDTSQLSHLTHPQPLTGHSDSLGAYQTAVSREVDVVPHYRNVISRNLLGAIKVPFRFAKRHPKTTLATGAGLTAALATGAYMYPETVAAVMEAASYATAAAGTTAYAYAQSLLQLGKEGEPQGPVVKGEEPQDPGVNEGCVQSFFLHAEHSCVNWECKYDPDSEAVITVKYLPTSDIPVFDSEPRRDIDVDKPVVACGNETAYVTNPCLRWDPKCRQNPPPKIIARLKTRLEDGKNILKTEVLEAQFPNRCKNKSPRISRYTPPNTSTSPIPYATDTESMPYSESENSGVPSPSRPTESLTDIPPIHTEGCPFISALKERVQAPTTDADGNPLPLTPIVLRQTDCPFVSRELKSMSSLLESGSAVSTIMPQPSSTSTFDEMKVVPKETSALPKGVTP